MDLKSQKLNFKSKVNNLIQQYDRQKAEEEQKKQQIKKQIMIQIIKNRQHIQNQQNKEKSGISTKQYTSKTDVKEQLPTSTPTAYFQATFKQEKSKQNQIKSTFPTNSQLQLSTKQDKSEKQEERQQKLEEITFNMNRRNKNIEEAIDQKSFKYQPLIEQKKETAKMQLLANKSDKIISKVSGIKQKQEYIQHAVEQNSSNEEEQAKPPPSGKFSKYFKEPNIPNERGSSYLNKQKEQTQKEQHLSVEDQVEYLDPPHEEEQRGVFLTMEESESMTASDLPKNYAFQIKMDKSIDNQNMEELKKQKIKQMQRKRQQRIQQFRRNESQKKVQMPKGRNSYSKKPEKIQKDQYEADLPPRSGTIEKKHQKSIKIQKQIPSRFIPIQPIHEPQQSQYNLRPPIKPYANYSHNYQPNRMPMNKQANDYQDRDSKPISPYRTPKTIQSQNRGKSINKNTNIFQGDIQRQKSSSKILTQPKIEPKDRKNSFTKQSNKKLMINAITYVCFPGQLNRRDRQKLIDVLQTSQYQFFIFLFKEYSRKIIKGIYILDSSQSRLQKIYGQKAPTQITADRVQEFYRFDSGSRQFKKVDGCRSFSLSIHAIDMR